MALLIIIFSLVAATIICLVSKNVRSMVLASTAAFGISAASASLIADKVARHGDYAPFRFVQINSLTAIVLLLIMIVGFFSAIYAYPYLAEEANKKIIGRTRTKQLFILLNVFMLLLVMAVTASYPILSWVFLESTTLAGAFLISFYNKPSTIEAAWKYLIINSVGLLLAFFGTLLFITNLPGSVSNGFVTWSILGSFAPHFNTVITKVAFIFILIGYGTKVGLAPMHTWKPDAYSKAPAPIGAVFSGALMPVALVIILKFRVITDVAVGTSFSQHLLIAFGLLSVIVAALSFITVVNYKRMLGYSSIEQAGLITLGFGFGGIGRYAAILQIIYHSLIKSSLFFTSGNFLLKFHSSKIKVVRGALSALPISAGLFLVGLLAVAGLPPFGIFISEIMTISSGLKHYIAYALVAMVFIVIAFIGLFKQASSLTLGEKPKDIKAGEGSRWLLFPPLAILGLALVLGFYMPPFLHTLIRQAVVSQ